MSLSRREKGQLAVNRLQDARLNPKTRTVICPNEDVARHVVASLVSASVWFEVDPLPDGLWSIKLKPEVNLHDVLPWGLYTLLMDFMTKKD